MLALDVCAERASEVAWVTEHLGDLEADFMAFYGVDDMLALDGPRWLRLATRTVAYQGVMLARAQSLMDAESQGSAPVGPVASSAATSHSGGGDVIEVDATPEMVASRPELAGLIEFKR